MVKEEIFDQEGLQALKITDSIKYVRTIVERTINEKIKVFIGPPKDIINAIRTGLFQIMNTIYARPNDGIPADMNFVNIVAGAISEQTNLRMDFDDFYKQTAGTIKTISSGTREIRAQFEEFLKELMMPIN
ncbi:hypothetical protein KKA33_02075 [Patescibacteria group bacterium]|nr:hypothetical protein [Patescibacteria group bacterium]